MKNFYLERAEDKERKIEYVIGVDTVVDTQGTTWIYGGTFTFDPSDLDTQGWLPITHFVPSNP